MDNVMKVICLWQIAYCRRCDQLHGRDGTRESPVIVADTGWPSSGCDAAVQRDVLEWFVGAFEKRRWYAAEEGVMEVYAFELVEKDDAKQGIMNWGLLHRNMTSKYSFEFSDGGEGGKGRRLVEVLVGFFFEVVILYLFM